MRISHIAALLALASLRAPGADAVRIAVVAGEGERAPKVGVVDRLMAELSQRPEVVILEREAIGKILAEQKLSLSGLTDHAHSVRLGLLLGADAMLAVERLGQEQDKARVEVKAVDHKSGEVVAIDRETAVEVDLTEQIAGKKALQTAAARIAERMLPKLAK